MSNQQQHEQIIEKLRKIKALVEQGVDGEANNAKTLLNQQLRKYGLTIEDLSSNDIFDYYVKYKTDNDRQLIVQICAKLDIEIFAVRRVKKLKKYCLECDAITYAEFSSMLEFHKTLLEKEMKIFLSSYIHKHDLFSANNDGKNRPKPTAEQLADTKAMFAMMGNLSDKKYESNKLRLGEE